MVYSYMFGPQRERPCPMCTSLLARLGRRGAGHSCSAWRSRSWRARRSSGWSRSSASAAGIICRSIQDISGEFSRDYHALTEAGGDDAAFNVFTRRNGRVTIRHFWGGEMNGASADPGQDPRGAPDLMPLWTILDTTPEGRGTDWYPKLNY